MSSNNIFQESNAQNAAPAQAPPTFLQKKGLLGKSAGGMSTMSPTDNFMSPISQKLNGAKQARFQKGAKPLPFASKLSSLAASGTPSSPADKKTFQ